MGLLDIFSRKQEDVGVIPRGLHNTVLQETTEANGFPVGAVINTRRNQATIGIQSDNDDLVPDAQWRAFEDAIVHMDGMVCTVTVDESCSGRQRSRAGITLRATDKSQRKDISEMMTSLAQHASDLHTAAAASGISATLMSAADLAATTARAWLPNSDTTVDQWPDLGAGQVTETTDVVDVAGRSCISWEVDLADAAIAAEIGEALRVVQLGPTVLRWVRVFRPVAVADAEGAAATGEGRHSGILSLVLDETVPPVLEINATASIEDLAGRVLSVLSARTRLRVRRAFGRQHVMATAGLGVGVLGWQNLEIYR